MNELIVGLDIGTHKICVVVAESSGDKLEIVGVGSHPSVGLRKGVVINIESTVNSIKKAVREAESMAGCIVDEVFVGIAGSHIKGFNSHGLIPIRHAEINRQDISKVVEAARAVAIPPNQEIIHTLPQNYIVDDRPGIQDPVGMSGVRLEANVHIVTADSATLSNCLFL